jgi:hypothetical protein
MRHGRNRVELAEHNMPADTTADIPEQPTYSSELESVPVPVPASQGGSVNGS